MRKCRSHKFRTVQYGNGTTNVQLHSTAKDDPWLYITGGGHGMSDAESDQYKGTMADEITEYLNGGSRPAWLSDGVVDGNSIVFAAGERITAAGPMIDENPPRLQWVQDERPAAQEMRRLLLLKLIRDDGEERT